MTLPWPRGSRKNVRIHYPENKLRTLVSGPGGMSREVAIASAERCLEELREPTLDLIAESIAEFCVAVKQGVKPADISGLQPILDRIISLSGTFGQRPLALAAMNLVDLLNAMLDRDCVVMAPIMVHVEAIKLLSPRAEPLSDIGVSDLLGGLDDILRYFDIKVTPDRLGNLFG